VVSAADTYLYKLTVLRKSNVIPVTGRGGLYSCEMSRIAHCLAIGSQMAALRAGLVLTPRKMSDPHFC
jgi:hypothetical protein